MRKVILFCAATLFSLLSFAQESDADIVKVGDNIPAFTLHSTANGHKLCRSKRESCINQYFRYLVRPLPKRTG